MNMDLTKEDKMLLAGAEDKFQQCCQQYRLTHTAFLDLRQRSLVEKLCQKLCRETKDVRCVFYGGYEDAERTMAVFLPDYAEPSDCPLSVIRINTAPGGKMLSHRDYLGSLLGLGIKREMTGDILTTDHGADIIILNEIEDFLLLNYDKAGRTALTLAAVPIGALCIPEQKTVLRKDTVASLRLDNVIAAAFSLSRAKAAEAIRSGSVFVNSMQAEKTDMQVAEGCKLVLRGKGKAYLREAGGKTRKDRIAVVIERYV